MLFGRRERFERTDVPQSTAAGMALAVSALVFVVVGLFIGWRVATVLANRDLSLTDRSLSNALDAQTDPEVPEGMVASSDIYNNVLLLTVDDLSADAPTLTGVELLSIDESAGTALLVGFPLNTLVENSAGASMIQSMCAGSGYASCIAPLGSAAGVKLTHVVVSSTDVWAKFDELRGMGARSLVTSSPEAFATIRTDMSNNELMDLVDRVGSIGSSNIARIDAPVGEATLDDGTGVAPIDSFQLRTALGLLISAE